MLETLDYSIRIGSTPTFIFRFVSLLSLRSTLRFFLYIRDEPSLEVPARTGSLKLAMQTGEQVFILHNKLLPPFPLTQSQR